LEEQQVAFGLSKVVRMKNQKRRRMRTWKKVKKRREMKMEKLKVRVLGTVKSE
jgi:hypothetical protein